MGRQDAGIAGRPSPRDICGMASRAGTLAVCHGALERASALVMKPERSDTVSCEGSEFEELAAQLLGAGHAMRFRARGSSMYPLVQDGDMLDVCPVGDTAIDVDDIVLYRSSRNGIVVHRVAAIIGQGEKVTLRVKGDSVGKADPEVQESQVLGRVVNIERRGRRIAPAPHLWRHRSTLHLRLLPLRRRAYAALRGALRGIRSLRVGGSCRF